MEFLYQNGAKLTVSDEKGRGCLHYAALSDDARYAVFTVMHACMLSFQWQTCYSLLHKGLSILTVFHAFATVCYFSAFGCLSLTRDGQCEVIDSNLNGMFISPYLPFYVE